MKLNNRCHEMDRFAAELPEMFHKKIFVFGTGQIGEPAGMCLKHLGLLGGFIDNDVRKQGMLYMGKPVLSLKGCMSEEKEPAILVAVGRKNTPDIEAQLAGESLLRGKDYFLHDEFMNRVLPVIAAYYLGKSFVSLAQISLTERCSLKCRKCAHACYNVEPTAEDLPLAEAYRSADSFFRKVDFIREFVLIGGEPLLYRKLAQVIQYIGEKYRAHIGIFSITTNGTITPGKDVLEACQKYNVLFRISNYAKALPKLKDSHKRLTDALQEYGITYILGEEDGNWIDYGFDYLEKDRDEEELIKTFDACLTPCREVRGNKLYFCVMARAVSDNLQFFEGGGKEEYLDLEKLNGKDYKKELLEFNLGYLEQGYLDMCRRCHGMDAEHYPIPVAEQMDVRKTGNR